jgi:hypothetical protein
MHKQMVGGGGVMSPLIKQSARNEVRRAVLLKGLSHEIDFDNIVKT